MQFDGQQNRWTQTFSSQKGEEGHKVSPVKMKKKIRRYSFKPITDLHTLGCGSTGHVVVTCQLNVAQQVELKLDLSLDTIITQNALP